MRRRGLPGRVRGGAGTNNGVRLTRGELFKGGVVQGGGANQTNNPPLLVPPGWEGRRTSEGRGERAPGWKTGARPRAAGAAFAPRRGGERECLRERRNARV